VLGVFDIFKPVPYYGFMKKPKHVALLDNKTLSKNIVVVEGPSVLFLHAYITTICPKIGLA
jgi:hypothetical protein